MSSSPYEPPGTIPVMFQPLAMHVTVILNSLHQTWEFRRAEQYLFAGCPELNGGYCHVSDNPGFGIELDEMISAEFPVPADPSFDHHWGTLLSHNGTIVKQLPLFV